MAPRPGLEPGTYGLTGYIPAQNVGAKVKDRIEEALIELGHINQIDFTPTAQVDELEERVSRLRRRAVDGYPRGNRFPKSVETVRLQMV